MKQVSLLDCTLRDGGYITNWQFSDKHQLSVIQSLIDANIEIVEVGYLNQAKGLDADSTLFPSMKSIDATLGELKSERSSRFVVMINLGDYDVNLLPDATETNVSGIRLAFHKKQIPEAYEEAKIICAKGYELYVQPMVSVGYEDSEMLRLVELFDKLPIYAFYIVDSFGSMTREQFKRLFFLIDNNLREGIVLGYHGHNNMQLAYSHAMDMVEMVSHRNIAIDASVYGMGRGAGNLNTEVFIDFLNKSYGASYKINPLLEIIDNYLESIYSKNCWGFSMGHYLSALYDAHPNYGSYLLNKKTLPVIAIESLLSNIENSEKHTFNEQHILELYIEFQRRYQQQSPFPGNLLEGKTPLLIASGSSLSLHLDRVKRLSLNDDIITIALNHTPDINVDYYFFSNQKRYLEFIKEIDPGKLIVGSNIELHTKHKDVYSINYNECSSISENVTSLMLHYFQGIRAKKVLIAGLDGFTSADENYYYEEADQPYDKQELINRDDEISRFVTYYSNKLRIRFITPSIFEQNLPLKILGVIPARYKSSRFEGKPLVKINGVEMIKRTYERAKLSDQLDELIVATDDQRIESFCESEGIPVMMTSESCMTGTDRLAEIAEKLDYDFYINIQGDEPVIDPDTISQVVREYRKYGDKYIAYNLYKDIVEEAEKNSSTIIKIVINQRGELINMSRAAIPFSKDGEIVPMKKQVCVYGFTSEALKLFSSHNKTLNERFEDIEILRFIDLGYKVKMVHTNSDSIAVDVPDDVKKVEAHLNTRNYQ